MIVTLRPFLDVPVVGERLVVDFRVFLRSEITKEKIELKFFKNLEFLRNFCIKACSIKSMRRSPEVTFLRGRISIPLERK